MIDIQALRREHVPVNSEVSDEPWCAGCEVDGMYTETWPCPTDALLKLAEELSEALHANTRNGRTLDDVEVAVALLARPEVQQLLGRA